MSKIFIVYVTDGWEFASNLRSFTTEQEALRYTEVLKEEDSQYNYYVEELGLYNKCEEIDV